MSDSVFYLTLAVVIALSLVFGLVLQLRIRRRLARKETGPIAYTSVAESFVDSGDAPRLKRGDTVVYVSKRHGTKLWDGMNRLRRGRIEGFDGSGRAIVMIHKGLTVRRKPHLLGFVAS